METASRDAYPTLAREIAAAAQGERPDSDLKAVATSALWAGTDREAILQACYAIIFERRMKAANSQGDDPVEDHVMDLMDRLTGWCSPHARL